MGMGAGSAADLESMANEPETEVVVPEVKPVEMAVTEATKEEVKTAEVETTVETPKEA